ncbi:MAG: hypothetical protein ACREDK_05810 [Thermoplasmata archaeon]
MRFGDLPFGLALLLVAGLAALGVAGIVRLGDPSSWYLGLLPAVVVAVLYLVSYDARPRLDAPPPPAEDFDDPVAEADRIRRGIELPDAPVPAADESTRRPPVPPPADGRSEVG